MISSPRRSTSRHRWRCGASAGRSCWSSSSVIPSASCATFKTIARTSGFEKLPLRSTIVISNFEPFYLVGGSLDFRSLSMTVRGHRTLLPALTPSWRTSPLCHRLRWGVPRLPRAVVRAESVTPRCVAVMSWSPSYGICSCRWSYAADACRPPGPGRRRAEAVPTACASHAR